MGIVIAKFRKKKSTEDILDSLDKEIKSIETFRRTTEQAHKKTVGRFLLISIVVYLGTAFLFYFYFFPATFYDRLFYIIPLILAPVIIISTKKGLTWYYNRKITKKQLKLESLNEEKKKILDKVMETETYKIAKNILEKYAPEQIRKSTYSVPFSDAMTPVKPNNSISSSVVPLTTGLRHRALLVPNQPSRASLGGFQTPSRPAFPSTTIARPSIVPIDATSTVGLPSMPLPLPRAILPRDRSVLDKMVEYLVGDGPSNRYALICKQCSSHNGMALKEEFEYLSFRCCYCFTFNPARKKRPFAPRLEYTKPIVSGVSETSGSDNKSSTSDTESDTDREKSKEREITTLYTSPNNKELIANQIDDEVKLSECDELTSMEIETGDALKDTLVTNNPFEEDVLKEMAVINNPFEADELDEMPIENVAAEELHLTPNLIGDGVKIESDPVKTELS